MFALQSVRPARGFAVLRVAAAVAAIPCLAAVPAETYAWRNVALRGGGYVTGLAFHPREAGLFYARTDVGGAYRWDAARRTWRPLTDAFDRASGNSELYGVLSIGLDPREPNRVYLACGGYYSEWARPGAVRWSDNRGQTWDGVDLPCKLGGNQDGRGTGERLAVDPHDGRVLFLGSSRDGLWTSRNAARNWQPVRGLSGRTGVTFVLFDPASGAEGKPTPVIYAGLDDRAKPTLQRSTDGGDTWAPVPGQPAGLVVHHAAFDGAGALWLAYGNGLGPNDVTDGAVWKYEPAAGRWTDVTPVRPDAARHDRFGYAGLTVDRQHPGTLFVSTIDRWAQGDEIFRSTDGGATWEPMLVHAAWNPVGAPYVQQLKPHWITELALDPFHPERLWFVTGYGVWATDRARAALAPGKKITWLFPNKGLEETVIEGLISPPEGAPLLSVMGDLGGFRHDDLAASPAGGMFQPFHGSGPGIDFAQQKPALMVRTHWGPTRGALSRDGGATWTNFPTAPAAATKNGPGIAAISADGARLVWLPKGSRPVYSTDGGATWSESRTDLVSTTEWTTYGPVADRVNPAKFYIYDSVNGGLYVSTDGGGSFAQTTSLPAGGGQLRAEPGAEGHLWVPTTEGLRVSADSGRTFGTLAGVAAAYQVGFGAPAPGQTAPAVFLDGKVKGANAFFRSDDGGKSWVIINDEHLRLGYIRAITGDPRVFGRVYLGTSGRGILVGEPVPVAK